MLREIGLGLLAPLRGAWLLLRRAGLWPYALPPLLLGVAWSGLFLLQELALPELPAGDAWYLVALRWGAQVALGLSVLLIQLLIVLMAPLLDWLGEQTEEALGVLPRGPSFLRELLTLGFVVRGVRALGEAFKLLGFKLVLWLLAWPLSLVPAVGAPLAYLVSGVATGVDFLDYPLARRGHRLGRKLAWARAHWAATLAFGAAVFGLLSVPVLAAMMLPACVVGGTDLVFRLGPLPGRAEVRAEPPPGARAAA